MKEIIGTFLFALIVSCLCYSLLSDSQQSYPWPVGINEVKESSLGLKREEGNIGDMQLVDGARPTTMMTRINEKSSERNIDMPLGANN